MLASRAAIRTETCLSQWLALVQTFLLSQWVTGANQLPFRIAGNVCLPDIKPRYSYFIHSVTFASHSCWNQCKRLK
jgi:hypothetical protein